MGKAGWVQQFRGSCGVLLGLWAVTTQKGCGCVKVLHLCIWMLLGIRCVREGNRPLEPVRDVGFRI